MLTRRPLTLVLIVMALMASSGCAAWVFCRKKDSQCGDMLGNVQLILLAIVVVICCFALFYIESRGGRSGSR